MEYSVRPISIKPNVFLHSCTVQRLNLKPRLHHLTLFIGTYFGNSSSNHSFQSFCYNFNFVPCNGHFQSFTFNHIIWSIFYEHIIWLIWAIIWYGPYHLSHILKSRKLSLIVWWNIGAIIDIRFFWMPRILKCYGSYQILFDIFEFWNIHFFEMRMTRKYRIDIIIIKKLKQIISFERLFAIKIGLSRPDRTTG